MEGENFAGEKIAITANVGDDRRTEGYVFIQSYNQAQRTQAALKKLAMWWGLALVSILIPVFHFVLVPLFFFLGFYFTYRGYKAEGIVTGGATKCPHCGTEVVVAKAALNWPISEICQGCARVVRISPKAD